MHRRHCFLGIPDEQWQQWEADSYTLARGQQGRPPNDMDRLTYVEEKAIAYLASEDIAICASCRGSGQDPLKSMSGVREQVHRECRVCRGTGTVALSVAV